MLISFFHWLAWYVNSETGPIRPQRAVTNACSLHTDILTRATTFPQSGTASEPWWTGNNCYLFFLHIHPLQLMHHPMQCSPEYDNLTPNPVFVSFKDLSLQERIMVYSLILPRCLGNPLSTHYYLRRFNQRFNRWKSRQGLDTDQMIRMNTRNGSDDIFVDHITK